MMDGLMNDALHDETCRGLMPWSLKDKPSLIERQFPVGRLSAETHKERDAKQAQTLTALGSYWKGRKPLVLVRAVVLGCLLPATGNATADLDIFLKLLAMDDGAFGRRFNDSAAAFARLFPDHALGVATCLTRTWRTDIPPETLKERVNLILSGSTEPGLPEQPALNASPALTGNAGPKKTSKSAVDFAILFPFHANDLTKEVETSWRWRDDLAEDERRARIAAAFAGLPYAERLAHVRRPEECSEAELLTPVWQDVNRHLGTAVRSIPELVEQLGIARFGRRPKLADTFCGGGSIPFEAARIGCDVYASDLNPIACMLTWGAFSIVGAPAHQHSKIHAIQELFADAVDFEITKLGIEHDAKNNRAKAYLYCLETRCPKTGWMVPLLPTLVLPIPFHLQQLALAFPLL